jgi:hypothetical protein
VVEASVQLTPNSITQGTSPGGESTFLGVRPGEYQLLIRAVGYNPAHATIRVPRDSGVSVEVTLAAATYRMSEICGTKQRFPKPWWKP